MSDIHQWLEELGLGKYADAFEENDVEWELLPELTDQALKDIGVASTGHRMKLLKAAKEIGDGIPRILHEPPAAEKIATQEAERRQLTVMFCDLVGSTALSVKLDPEDLREVMAAYQKTAGAVIERYEGHVAQYLGDGLMTYFGWPRAHEDDAQRAVRAGLDIVTAIRGIEAPVGLSVRVGISTGPVVVGETGAGDASVPKAAVGEAPNVAARVQGLAEPNTVTIGEATHRLIGGAFELEDLGAHKLKGIAAPVAIFRVIGASDVESRFDASRGAGLTPLVGRDEEVGLLFKRWEQAKDGEGQVVLLSGEAGIGKSRIAQALRERIGADPHTRLRYQCSPYHANSAFYPIIDQLERAAGFARGDELEAKLDKLETLLTRSADDITDIAPLFAALLSLPLDRYPSLNLSPQKQKENTIAALADRVALLARQQSTLMIFEDVHWIDPTTLEVLGAVIERVRDAAVLAVITYRPEFEPPWIGHGHISTLTLNRLSRRQGADMVAKVTSGKALPDEVLDQIVAKTDGVPLFVEELTKTVLEAGFLKDSGDAYTLDGPLPPLAIPTTLQDSLMARLDRLAPVKEIAQIGACIGREFSYELLAALLPLRDNDLRDSLDQLVSSELVFCRGTPPEATYNFKHALVQDAAYESLLKSKRQQLHTRIGSILEERFPETAINQPEVLARHYEAAGLIDQAVDYLTRAGQRATRRSTNAEALGYLGRGLALLDGLPETPERVAQELTLQISLGAPLVASKGYGAPEVEECFTRARALCRQIGDTPEIFQAIWGLYSFYLLRGRLDKALEMAKQCLALAQRTNDTGILMEAHRSLGLTHLYRGDLLLSRTHLEKTIALYDIDRHREHCVIYGEDPFAVALYTLAIALFLLGHPEQAWQRIREAEDHARTLNHAHTTAYTITFISKFHQLNRQVTEARKRALEASEMASEQGLFGILIPGTIVHGWTLAHMGRGEDGVAQVRQGMLSWNAAGAGLVNSYFGYMLADSLTRMGQIEDALSAVEDALNAVQTNGEYYMDPELRRIRGELLLTQGASEAEVESCFRDAIERAQRYDSKMFELRATTSLARLWQSQGKRQEAHDVLAPVYDWFTEGFDTADLKDAKTLLEELK